MYLDGIDVRSSVGIDNYINSRFMSQIVLIVTTKFEILITMRLHDIFIPVYNVFVW